MNPTYPSKPATTLPYNAIKNVVTPSSKEDCEVAEATQGAREYIAKVQHDIYNRVLS